MGTRLEGVIVGDRLGAIEGDDEGWPMGVEVGVDDGDTVGREDGFSVGVADGRSLQGRSKAAQWEMRKALPTVMLSEWRMEERWETWWALQRVKLSEGTKESV